MSDFYFAFSTGTKHFLLICKVKPEDSGEIKFVSKQVESIAYLEVEGIEQKMYFN